MSQRPWTLAAAAGLSVGVAAFALAQGVDPRVLQAEAERVALVEKVTPYVVAVFAHGGQGGGSGVLIDKTGYALTNFHVVAATMPTMKCGLPDGKLYDAVLVGLDKVGDVALIKLLPKDPGQEFPAAPLGDSDTLRAGDWALVMGNPFLLATDFQPTATYGLVSGVHRYQYPAGTLLEYTDCIQVDASINPGNSGGPLFNTQAELIGINGRGSFDKRGRVNVGVGYAISIHQIKNFLGHLRAGIDTDHATLGATVRSAEDDEGAGGRIVVDAVLENSDARRRGLDTDDELVSFAGRPMRSVNQFKNVLGLFPKGWRVPLAYRRGNDKHEILVRLMQSQPAEAEVPEQPRRGPGRVRRAAPPPTPSPALKLFEAKPGFANYYFNRLERDRLLAAFKGRSGDAAGLAPDWDLEGEAELKEGKLDWKLSIRDEPETGTFAVTYRLRPELLPALPDTEAKSPALGEAVRKVNDLLGKDAKAFPQDFRLEGSAEKLLAEVGDLRKQAEGARTALGEALKPLRDAGGGREAETPEWRAAYDYTLALAESQLAYLADYQAALGKLEGEAREAKPPRAWRLAPVDKPSSGTEAETRAGEAAKAWERAVESAKGTKREAVAAQTAKLAVGVRLVPRELTKTVVRMTLGSAKYELDPMRLDAEPRTLQDPPGSGGFLVVLYQYRRLLTQAAGAFDRRCEHGGAEPFYPPPADGHGGKSPAEWRVDCEVLATEHAGVPAKWYFARDGGTLLGCEANPAADEDPCEVYLGDYRDEGGRLLPHRIEVRRGDERYGVFTVKAYRVAPGGRS